MEGESKLNAQSSDGPGADLAQSDGIVCWTEYLRQQDDREQRQREGMVILGTPEGLTSDDNGRCEPGEDSPPAGDR